MPFCSYGVTVVGPGPDVVALHRKLLPTISYDGCDLDHYIADLSGLFADIAHDEPKRIWLQNFSLSNRWGSEYEDVWRIGTTLGFETEIAARWPKPGAYSPALWIYGETSPALPRTICERLSGLFPSLGFRVSGTTEHEYCEDWIIFAGAAHPLTLKVTDGPSGVTEWRVREGVLLDPPEIDCEPMPTDADDGDVEMEVPPEVEVGLYLDSKQNDID